MPEPRIGWYIANVCFTQLFVVELALRWFVEGGEDVVRFFAAASCFPPYCHEYGQLR